MTTDRTGSTPILELPVRYFSADDRPLISVTQILTIAGRINPDWYSPEAAERGEAVHKATERIDRGEDVHLADDLMGYAEAYQAFLATVRPTYAAGGTECRVESQILGLAGRIDRVCASIYGSPGILDFKTGQEAAWHGQQLAAYNRMRPTGARWCCYLRPDGKYRVKLHDDPADHWKFFDDLRQARQRLRLSDTGDVWTWT